MMSYPVRTVRRWLKKPKDSAMKIAPARGKKRKRLTCSAEGGVYCQLDDCGLCFDLKRRLFKDPVETMREETKKCTGGSDIKNRCEKCHYVEVILEHWARPTRSSRPIRSKKAARNYRRRERKGQERWKNSELHKEEELAKVTSVILEESKRRPVHYATSLAEGITSLKRTHCRPICGIDRSCLGIGPQIIEEPFDNPWCGKRIVFE